MERSEDELYFRCNSGKVARTIEITDSMFVDVDTDGTILGVEWINFNHCTQEVANDSKNYHEVPELKELKKHYPEKAAGIATLLTIILA